MNKHAYLIVAHNNFYILEKLIRLIDDTRNDIYLHIDKKTKNFDFEYFKKIPKHSNIYFIKRLNVGWGAFSLIKTELSLFKSASKKNYEYYHLISGVDLPIKTQDYIHDFFNKNKGKEFLTCLKDEFTEKQNIERRLSKYYLFQQFNRNNKFIQVINNILLKIQDIIKINRYNYEFKIYYGANWASLTHEAVMFLLSKEDFIQKTFKYTLCCDEVYKQTVIMQNEVLKQNLYFREYNEAHISYNMRHVDWKRGSPYVFREKDYKELKEIYGLFARKFDEKIDKNIIDLIYNMFKK